MSLAREIWRLARDVLWVLAGLYLFKRLADGTIPQDLRLPMLPLAAALVGLPYNLRRDEKRHRKERGR